MTIQTGPFASRNCCSGVAEPNNKKRHHDNDIFRGYLVDTQLRRNQRVTGITTTTGIIRPNVFDIVGKNSPSCRRTLSKLSSAAPACNRCRLPDSRHKITRPHSLDCVDDRPFAAAESPLLFPSFSSFVNSSQGCSTVIFHHRRFSAFLLSFKYDLQSVSLTV